ncbi:hypothetical protein SNEBB_000556 [Seison nebaliae]|nr:hypothetical protein SNEBB_000556 [Seison nebaliae]
MVYKYLTNLLGDPELQLTFEDISVHSFIDDLAKSSKLVANLDDVDKKEKEEENYKNPKNIQEEMKSKTINILGRFNNSLSHSNLVDKFISELETNYENDFLTMKKDELIGFIEDCSIGYYRQIFVTNTLLPILNNIILEQNKQKEMFTEIYRELKLDYKNKNKKGINMEYDFRLLERKLSDIDLEIEKIVNLVYIVELDDQNRKNRSTVVPLEHIFQMLLFYLMLQPENYFTLTEYIGRILLQP